MCLGIPARVLSVSDSEPASRPAVLMRADGVLMSADLALVPEATTGDYVVSHSGLATSVLTKGEALEAMRLLDEVTGSHLRTEEKERTMREEHK